MKILDVIFHEAYGVVPGDPIGDAIKQAQAKKQQPTPLPTNKPATAPAKKTTAPVQPQPMTGTTLENVLRDVAIRAGIVGHELAQFLAQCAHETANFSTLSEFGDSKTFLKYDPKVDPVKAKQLGNTQPGDGERYKGRGYLQITGRFNYAQIGQALGLPLEQKPQMLEDPAIAAQASIWFWKNRVKPKVDNFADTKAVTSVINPALRGLQQRHGNFKDYVSTTSIPADFAVKEGNIGAEDLIDIYVRGKFKGKSVTFPVAKAFPNKFLNRVIKKLADKYNVNPDAIVYGPTKQTEDYNQKDIKLIAKHYFPIDDQEIIEKYKIRKDSRGYYLPEFNTSGRIFNLNITSLMRLYGRPHSVRIGSIDEAKKKKRKKFRWAAYGPGAFGLYGVDTGYSGDGGVGENFADGKVKGKSRPGRVKRAGASCDGSVTSLRQRAKNTSGERAKMYHWCANMKSGRKK